jgi:AbrB family looped-hinge helix DNA binding protein
MGNSIFERERQVCSLRGCVVTIVKISARWQLVIPVEIRKNVGIRPGDSVSIQEHEGMIIIVPMVKHTAESLRGILKGYPSLARALLQSREEERRREDENSPPRLPKA